MRTHPLLLLSLVANIFLLGAIGGGAWAWHRAGEQAIRGTVVAGGGGQRWRLRAADALPPADGARFRQALRQEIADAHPLVEQARAARLRAATLLASDRYDPKATLAELDGARAAEFRFRQRLEARIVVLAQGLPADERQALAAALERPARRDRAERRARREERLPAQGDAR